MLVRPLVRFAFAIAASLSLAAPARAEQWSTYVNPRFGTTADYPASMFSVALEPPANGDGQAFTTPDGRAKLSIYGSRNAERQTPEAALRQLEGFHPGRSYSYRRATARFYVISGVEAGRVFYDRCNFGARPDGVLDCVALEYPASEARTWDGVVARISQSLRAGRGVEGR